MNTKKITINLYISKKIIYLQKNYKDFFLLNIIESQGINIISNQCRQGLCGTCRIILLKGKVTYNVYPLAFFQKKEILPCCCKVNTSLILKI